MAETGSRTLTEIPFCLDAEGLLKKAHVERGGRDETEFREMLSLAEKVGRPKALYRVAYLEEKGPDTIRVEGVLLRSAALARNLSQSERVFAYVATCGTEMDESPPSNDDPLKPFWWDTIKEALLRIALSHLMEQMNELHRLGKTAHMSPGSGDVGVWPIEQQKDLFQILGDVEGEIGVELTPSFLMRPNKTVSGIRFPTERDYRACQVCHRENCSSRSAPLDEKLWADLMG